MAEKQTARIPDPIELAAAVRGGDRRALARAITLAESSRGDHRELAEAVLGALLPVRLPSLRIGISGVPGVGKSTFIETLGRTIVAAGHRLAVLAVDPSSRRSGGSILGDKTRMADLAREPAAFIRPTPTGGLLGGVARRTRDAVMLCEAAGFEIVIVETVGTGQSETAVADLVDMVVLLLLPGGGDELQGLKKGILEIADLILVNKADGDLAAAAERAVGEYGGALHLLRAASPHWTPEIMAVSAFEGRNVALAWDAVGRFRAAMEATGALAARRAAQARVALWSELGEGLLAQLRQSPLVRDRLAEIEAEVVAGRAAASVAARRLLAAFLGPAAAGQTDA
ncbi:MAG: ATPase/protein kinase [Rhodospirillales bacterium]|nr:ATPase/protein kinase [Rhodospirillales bacterium]